MTRTFWLAFGDDEVGPLGVCVVDVTEAHVAAALAVKPLPNTAKPGAEWLMAAIHVAWMHDCNPGGQVLCQEIPSETPLPRNRLLALDDVKPWTTVQ